MKRQHSILFGNGFNRLTSEDLRWDNFLRNTFPNDKEKDGVTIDYSLLYEKLLLDEYKQSDNTINSFENFKKTLMANAVKNFSPNEKTIELLDGIANLPVCYYMTTNYDTTFESVFFEDKSMNVQKDYSEPLFSLHRRHTVKKNDILKTIWYLHGETGNVKTMTLGFDQYSISLGNITNYLIHGGQTKSEKHIVQQYKQCLSRFQSENEEEWFPYMLWRLNQPNTPNCQYKNWVDLFFLTDVHIIAQGLDFSEIDIWWLLNKRARYKAAAKRSKYLYEINNKVYYYGSCSAEQRALLEAFDVQIINVPRMIDEDEKVNYYKYYSDLIKEMRFIINNTIV